MHFFDLSEFFVMLCNEFAFFMFCFVLFFILNCAILSLLRKHGLKFEVSGKQFEEFA